MLVGPDSARLTWGSFPAWWFVYAGDCRASEGEGKEGAVEPGSGVQQGRALDGREAARGE
eukprot:2332398-Lingulodinium_polyedra.AAC.1